MQHQPGAEADEPPKSPGPTSSIFTMEAREGRIGNAFACERCRKHKVRCVPSDTAGICQRCQKARVECIEHVARRRPAKARSSDGQPTNRMRDFDKKLDKLSAIVATMAPSPLAQPALPSVTTLPSQLPDLSHKLSSPVSAQLPSITPIPKIQSLPAPGPLSENTASFWDSINDSLLCLGRIDPVIRTISLAHMQSLLDTYRSMADFFPFVTLPKDVPCRDLVIQRPVLTLAVITAATSESISLQMTLSREFRKVIMVKIMNGQKDLDVLQGILVFLAWHHHYMDAQSVSIPMLLQLAIGMAHDLGLDNISHATRSPLFKGDPREREAKRAYLGCYYLAASLSSLEPGKTRPISYTSNLRRYAADLATAWDHKSDAVLPVLIDMCQFTEDVEETFQASSEQALVARSQVKRLSDKWEHIRAATKILATNFKTLQWAQLAAHVHLYMTAASIEVTDRESTPWASGFQLSLRVTCLRSIEQFLDNGLKLPSAQYAHVSLVDWLSLVSSVTNLSKLAIQSTSLPGWDPNELQIAKSFDYFRDQLSSQMPRPRDANEDVFERFRRVTSVMKTALNGTPGRSSPNGSTFELARGSGRTVSLLQELPLPKINGMGSSNHGPEKLPSLWRVNPTFDISSNEFHWKFLLGTV